MSDNAIPPLATEGQNGPVDPVLATIIRAVANYYQLPPVVILSVQSAYAGFINPQTKSDEWITGTVQFPDGRTIMAMEFFPAPTNNVDLRMKSYGVQYGVVYPEAQ